LSQFIFMKNHIKLVTTDFHFEIKLINHRYENEDGTVRKVQL
jgi:hypothetical protein